jgi:hypothetical protein
MPKLRGPLFSIAAHGTIASAVTYRTTARGTVAQRPPIPRQTPSTPQLSERARCRAAAANWSTLDATARAPWLHLAVSRSLPVWIVFFSESTLQQVEPPARPLLPAA